MYVYSCVQVAYKIHSYKAPINFNAYILILVVIDYYNYHIVYMHISSFMFY